MRQLPKNDDTIGNLMQAFTPIVKVHYTDFVNGIDGSDNNVQKSKLHTHSLFKTLNSI